MTNLTLLAKAFHGSQLKHIAELMQNQFEDLDVDAKVLGNSQNRWVEVSLSGEDEAVAKSFLRKEIGFCPVSLESVEVGSELKGYVSKVDSEWLLVDVGILQPKIIQATVPLSTLQRQLVEGKVAEIKKLSEAYALTEGIPLTVTVTAKDADSVHAGLAPVQVERLTLWRQSLLDRLIVLRVSKELVTATLERTRLDRDVFDVEALGVFEFALTCKLGTAAAGLIPRVGRYMRYGVFTVFNSKRLASFLGEQGLTL